MSKPSIDLQIWSYSDRSVNLFWTIKFLEGPFVFDIYRGASPSSLELIAENIIINSYIDDDLEMFTKNRNWMYKVIGREIDTSRAVESEVKHEHYEKDKKYADLVRRDRLVLQPVRPGKRPIVGVKSFVYIEKTFGERCEECWDDIKRLVRDAQCQSCYRTGFEGGYFDPILFYADYDPDPKIVNLTRYFELQSTQIGAWTSNFPPISPRDVIIEESNERWRVAGVKVIEYRRKRFRQFLQLEHLERSEVQQRLPYPEDFL